MNVTIKYDTLKFKNTCNIENYISSLEGLQDYENETEWVNGVRNISERLNFLKESYKLIANYRKKRRFVMEEESSDEDPRRTRRRGERRE